MIKPRIVVTGATGKTGSAVVSELLPSAPRFATESAIWRSEHGISDFVHPVMPGREGERTAITRSPQSRILPGEPL
jgi:hypothetical protein